MSTQVLKSASYREVELDRALAGSAGDRNDGVRFRVQVQGRHYRDPDLDLSRTGVVRVLRAQHRAAASLDARLAGLCADPAVL